MEIVHIAPGGDYERYEELTLKKVQLEKDADHYENVYTREFGDKIAENFKLKVDCIALKKEINIYVRAKNQGRQITRKEVEDFLKKKMASYQLELDDLISKNKQSKGGRVLTNYEVKEIKDLYRKIAKMLHPDISPIINDYPQFTELFAAATVYYHANDLKMLRQIEVVIKSELEKCGIEGFDMVIDHIEQKIDELENDIAAIIGSIPYIYKDLLLDKNKVKEKHEELDKEKADYVKYKKELEEKLAGIREYN